MAYLRFAPWVVALLCVIVALVCYNGWTAAGSRADAETKRATDALAQNARDVVTIAELTRLNEAGDRATAELSEKIETLATAAATQTAKLTQLEKTNAEVSAYLSGNIPADLSRLLDNSDNGKDGSRYPYAADSFNDALSKADKDRKDKP